MSLDHFDGSFGPKQGTKALPSLVTEAIGRFEIKGLLVAGTTTPVVGMNESIGRRIGYGVGIVVNTLLLYAVNVWPGWRWFAFVTEDAEQLVPLLNASLVVGMVANLIYIVFDRRWVKALGDLVTVGVSLVLLVWTWQVFPFAFTDPAIDWALVVRGVLAVSILGCVIALVVQLVVLVRELAGVNRSKSRS